MRGEHVFLFFVVRFVMQPGTYGPSRHHLFMGWGVGMIVAGVSLFCLTFVSLAIGVFDKLDIGMDGVTTIVIITILIGFIGLVLVSVGLVKAFRARRSKNVATARG